MPDNLGELKSAVGANNNLMKYLVDNHPDELTPELLECAKKLIKETDEILFEGRDAAD